MASLWTKFTDIFSRNKSGVVPQAPSGTGTTKYLREDGTWAEPSGGGGGASALSDLTDVDLSTPIEGQALVYNESTSKWENGDVASDMEEITLAYYNEHKSEIEASGKTYLVTGPTTSPVAAGGGVNVYSSEEQCIGQWIDGKPIYERVITFGELPTSSVKQIDISSLNVDEIIELKGMVKSSSTQGYYRTLPMVDNSSFSNCIRLDVSGYALRVITSAAWAGYEAKIILQYTKTTDTPVSLVPYVYDASSIKYGNGSVADIFKFGYLLGSQILLSDAHSTSSTRMNVWCHALDRINHIFEFANLTIPSGFKIKYKLSVTGNSRNNNELIVGINGITMIQGARTWAGSEPYREILFSDFFEWSDFTPEPIYGYSHADGVNLYIGSSVSGLVAESWDITLHAYLTQE